MGVRISGLGSYLPARTITRAEWLASAEGKARYGQMPEEYFDIPDVVHHADENETASFMGAQACLAAVANAGLKPEDIDLVLCFSTAPDQTYPGDGQSIVHLAQLRNATALDLDLACSSFQSLLMVGSALVNQGLHRRVLAVCIANWVHRAIDKTQDYSPLGDGAGAVVLEPDERDSLIGVREKREERFFDFVKMGCANRTGRHETIQFVFNDEFKDFVKMHATDVAKELMVATGHLPSKVDWFICHQVGPKAMRGWCRTLELDEGKLLSTYLSTGNAMASNMPLVLDHYVNREPRIKRGDVILFYSLSMGYHASAMLWRF